MLKSRLILIVIIVCLIQLFSERYSNASEKQIACGSRYLHSLVISVCGEDIPAVLLVPAGTDPYELKKLDEENLAVAQSSSLMLIHKQQRMLQKQLEKLNIPVLVIDQTDLIIPKQYYQAAQTLEAEVVKLFPEYEIYMDEKMNELKEKTSLLNNRLLAKGRDAGFADVACVVSQRQKAFALWVGLDVIGTYRDDMIMTASASEKLIQKAKEKGCWLIICNRMGESQKYGDIWSKATDGEKLVLSDFPEPNDEIGMPGWQVLLEDNVKRVADVIIWH